MLRFRLFGMPVTVRSSFLVVAALIGFLGVGSIEQTIAWIVIVFISILIHELGHAFTALRYGSNVSIELNGFGGLTRWAVSENEITPGRRALIAAAGSAVGLAFGGLVWLVASRFGPYDPLVAFVLENTIYVNVFWGLLNWLPIRPLDGGHLLESLLEKIAPQRARGIARVVFISTAAGALALALRFRLIFIAVLAGWLLLSEFSAGRPSQQTAGLPTLSYDDPAEHQETQTSETLPPTTLPSEVLPPEPAEPVDTPERSPDRSDPEGTPD